MAAERRSLKELHRKLYTPLAYRYWRIHANCLELQTHAEGYPARSATPPATSKAAIQRLVSTRSCKKIFAAKAFPMNVRDAAAGPTKLTSPQDKAKSKLKNATAMAPTPSTKLRLPRTRATTVH